MGAAVRGRWLFIVRVGWFVRGNRTFGMERSWAGSRHLVSGPWLHDQGRSGGSGQGWPERLAVRSAVAGTGRPASQLRTADAAPRTITGSSVASAAVLACVHCPPSVSTRTVVLSGSLVSRVGTTLGSIRLTNSAGQWSWV